MYIIYMKFYVLMYSETFCVSENEPLVLFLNGISESITTETYYLYLFSINEAIG